MRNLPSRAGTRPAKEPRKSSAGSVGAGGTERGHTSSSSWRKSWVLPIPSGSSRESGGAAPAARASSKAAIRFAIAPVQVGQVVQEDAAEPEPQLGQRPARELREVALGLEEGVLDEVRRPGLGPEVGGQLVVGDQEQVVTAVLQQSSQGL